MVRASNQEVLSNPVPFRVTVIFEADVIAEKYAHGAAITAGVLVIAIVLFAFTIPAVVRCKRHIARAKQEKQKRIDEENIKKELEIEQNAYTNQALIHDDETAHASRVKVSEAKWDEKLRNGVFDTKNLNMSWLNLHCSRDDDSGTGMELESLKSTSSSEKSPERKFAQRNHLALAVPSAMTQRGSAPCLLSQDSPKGILKKSAPKSHAKRSCHHSRHRQIQSQDSVCSSVSSQSGSQRTEASVSSAKYVCVKKNDDTSSNVNKNTTVIHSHEHVTIVVSDASDDDVESAKYCK